MEKRYTYSIKHFSVETGLIVKTDSHISTWLVPATQTLSFEVDGQEVTFGAEYIRNAVISDITNYSQR